MCVYLLHQFVYLSIDLYGCIFTNLLICLSLLSLLFSYTQGKTCRLQSLLLDWPNGNTFIFTYRHIIWIKDEWSAR